MVEQLFEYTEDDLKFYHLCNTVGKLSTCLDKQVGTVIVDRDTELMSVGFNHVKQCNGLCDKTCRVVHSEAYAVARLNPGITPFRAYVNLFPCLNCQNIMSNAGIQEVYVFGAQGNKAYEKRAGLRIYLLPNLPKLLTEYNGPRNTRAVVQGECAELITAISNYDARHDRNETKAEQRTEVLKEFVDIRLQSYTLQESLPMPELSVLEFQKWNKLIAKFKSIFFPGIDL